ncbi:hypothetical protein LA080_011515 [Diaporthe eres]|nr:hypothetical protein LA080_011515 [Diaporthe eres]
MPTIVLQKAAKSLRNPQTGLMYSWAGHSAEEIRSSTTVHKSTLAVDAMPRPDPTGIFRCPQRFINIVLYLRFEHNMDTEVTGSFIMELTDL